MRPHRLELEGFSVFRDHTVIDFDGVDLFALSGPTGSGKSTVVDAMVFVLYGAVPRLDKRAVSPVISLGRNEARARLDFTVGGVSYSAVRVVRRNKSGRASTKEARLERGDGEVLAGTADELTATVERLLGLSYQHFVKCVLLPQGDFAAFLHATGSERQELLVTLLDLDLYERMRVRAHEREEAAAQRLNRADGQLDALAYATPEARAAAAEEITRLEALQDEVAAGAQAARDRELAHQQAQEQQRLAVMQRGLLDLVVPPEGLAQRADAVALARRAVSDAEASEEKATTAESEAEEALGSLPPRSELERAFQAHRERAQLATTRQEMERRRAAHEPEWEQLAAKVDAAEGEVDRASIDLEAARDRNRAHELAAHLVAGQPCPVCRQEVADVPEPSPAATADLVAEAQGRHRKAHAALKQARAEQERGQAQRLELDAQLASVAERLAQLGRAVAAHPDPHRVEVCLADVAAAEEAVADAREARRWARQERAEARGALAEVEALTADDLKGLDAVRDEVSPLGPPPLDRSDIAGAWSALVAWADERRPELDAAVASAAERVKAAADEHQAAVAALAGLVETAGVTVARGSGPVEAVAGATGAARDRLERLDRDLATATELRNTLADAQRERDLVHALAQHLSATGFKKWLLDETLTVLCEGATEILRTLSAGAYSLMLDEQSNFAVVDHRNADEQRSARTLSGGETFLASLALALGLADQVGQLAAGGAARLESLFLDEGFGTLDADTLDTVAVAIEELGATGRMVGLISHVAELAERVPVRYLVNRTPAGSTVERLVA